MQVTLRTSVPTAEEIAAAVARVEASGLHLKQTPFALLTPEEIDDLNLWADQHCVNANEYWGKAEIEKALGAERLFVKSDEPGAAEAKAASGLNDTQWEQQLADNATLPPKHTFTVQVGSKKYIIRFLATNNSTNRPLGDANCKHLLRQALAGRWARNGENLIFDASGQIASAQHRLWAWLEMCYANPSVVVPVSVTRNVPVPFVDSVDTGKARNNTDAANRHADIMPASIMIRQNVNPELRTGYGDLSDKARSTSIKDLNAACRMLWMRVNGKGTKETSSQFNDKKQDGFWEVLNWFGKAQQMENACGLELGNAMVYGWDNAGKSGLQGSIAASSFGRASLVTALALYSNRKLVSKCEVVRPEAKEGSTVKPRVTVRALIEDNTLSFDLDFAAKFMEAITDETGFARQYYAYFSSGSKTEDRKRKATYHQGFRFEALCRLIEWFAEFHKVETVENPITDPTTGAVEVVRSTRVECPEVPITSINVLMPASIATAGNGIITKFSLVSTAGDSIEGIDPGKGDRLNAQPAPLAWLKPGMHPSEAATTVTEPEDLDASIAEATAQQAVEPEPVAQPDTEQPTAV